MLWLDYKNQITGWHRVQTAVGSEEFLNTVHQRFNKDELKRLIVALEFVLYVERRGRMIELVEAVRGKRPHLFE